MKGTESVAPAAHSVSQAIPDLGSLQNAAISGGSEPTISSTAVPSWHPVDLANVLHLFYWECEIPHPRPPAGFVRM